MGIYCLRISIAECPCMDIFAWLSMWISTLAWIIEHWRPKLMDIHVDIRGFLEIHVWICYEFSDQGTGMCERLSYGTEKHSGWDEVAQPISVGL